MKKKGKTLNELSVEIKLAFERYKNAIRRLETITIERLEAKAEKIKAQRLYEDALERDLPC